MEVKTIITKAGLTGNETKCYLALLESGPLTIQELTRKTKIHRVSLYPTIEGLEKKGFISYDIKNKYRKRIIPSSPRKLLDNIQSQQRELKKSEIKIREILPELLGQFRYTDDKPMITMFEGVEGACKAFEDTLTAHEELRGFSNIPKLNAYIPDEWMDDYRRRKSVAGLRGRFLVPQDSGPKEYVQTKYLDRGYKNVPEVRRCPFEEFLSLVELDIYDNKVCIISISKEEEISLIIQSRVIYTTLDSIFNTLWKMSEIGR